MCRAHARIPAIVRLFSREQRRKPSFPPTIPLHTSSHTFSFVPSSQVINATLDYLSPVRSARSTPSNDSHAAATFLFSRVHRFFALSLLLSPLPVIELLFVMTGNCCALLHAKYIISGFPGYSGFLGNGPTRRSNVYSPMRSSVRL